MTEATFRVQFAYTTDDYAEGRRGATVFRASRTSLLARVSFALLGTIGGPLILLSNKNDHFAMVVASMVAGAGVWYLYAVIIGLWRSRFGVRSAFQKIEELQGSFEMQFDEEGVSTHSTHGFYQWPWKRHKGLSETTNLFLLSLPRGSFLMIPKRAFAQDQLAPFRELLHGKVSVTEPQPSRVKGFLIALAIGVSVLLVLYAALRIMGSKS